MNNRCYDLSFIKAFQYLTVDVNSFNNKFPITTVL